MLYSEESPFGAIPSPRNSSKVSEERARAQATAPTHDVPIFQNPCKLLRKHGIFTARPRHTTTIIHSPEYLARSGPGTPPSAFSSLPSREEPGTRSDIPSSSTLECA